MSKKYVVAEGNAFTVNGHIYSAGDVIPESVFTDKNYFAKLLSEKKILVIIGDEIKEETNTEVSEDSSTSTNSTKKSKKSKAE